MTPAFRIRAPFSSRSRTAAKSPGRLYVGLAAPGKGPKLLFLRALTTLLAGGAKDMRNLTVAIIHTYYVMAGAVPVLVHNCNEGSATVYLHEPEGPNLAGHASVEIECACGEVMHTHQAGTIGTRALARPYTSDVPDTSTAIRVPLPNVQGAFAAAEVYMSRLRLGAYDLETKSCMTYCADILRAGGRSDAPRTTQEVASWLQETDF